MSGFINNLRDSLGFITDSTILQNIMSNKYFMICIIGLIAFVVLFLIIKCVKCKKTRKKKKDIKLNDSEMDNLKQKEEKQEPMIGTSEEDPETNLEWTSEDFEEWLSEDYEEDSSEDYGEDSSEDCEEDPETNLEESNEEGLEESSDDDEDPMSYIMDLVEEEKEDQQDIPDGFIDDFFHTLDDINDESNIVDEKIDNLISEITDETTGEMAEETTEEIMDEPTEKVTEETTKKVTKFVPKFEPGEKIVIKTGIDEIKGREETYTIDTFGNDYINEVLSDYFVFDGDIKFYVNIEEDLEKDFTDCSVEEIPLEKGIYSGYKLYANIPKDLDKINISRIFNYGYVKDGVLVVCLQIKK